MSLSPSVHGKSSAADLQVCEAGGPERVDAASEAQEADTGVEGVGGPGTCGDHRFTLSSRPRLPSRLRHNVGSSRQAVGKKRAAAGS